MPTRRILIPEPELIFNNLFIPFIKGTERVVVPIQIEEGGRGSGKSRAIAQKLILLSLKHKARVALVRKVFDTIRESQYREIKDVVSGWGLSNRFDYQVSPLSIHNSAGSEFICKGLDKNEKIKSLASVDVVWIEEATELTHDDWINLSLSIRGLTSWGDPRQLIISFNRQAGSWTEKEFFDESGQPKNNPLVYHQHSTFNDNKFLDEWFLARLEQMRIEDEELYKKNALGLPIALKGLIFPSFTLIDEMPSVDEIIYGLDFGIADPTVLLKIGIAGRDIYFDEMIYERGLTNNRLIEMLPEIVADNSADIYADAEDKNRIEEIHQAHWNVIPSNKEPNSVIEGLAFMRAFRHHITRRSTNTIKDWQNYKWKTDKNGNTIVPEKPLHSYSHSPDAARYAMWTHLKKVIPAVQGLTRKTEKELDEERKRREKEKSEEEDIVIESKEHLGAIGDKMKFRYTPKSRKAYSF